MSLPPDLVPVKSSAAAAPDDLIPVPPQGDKLFDNRGIDDPNGEWKNAGTGIAKMATHIPGIFGDINEMGDRLTSNVHSIFSSRTAEQIRADNAKRRAEQLDRDMASSDFLTRTMAKASRYFHAPSGEDIYKAAVKPVVGEYHPTTIPGQLGQIALESAMPGPGGKRAAAERILEKAPGLLDHALNVVGKLKMPAVGAAMGATGAGVTQLTGSPAAGLLTSLALPFAPSAARRIAPNVVDRMSMWMPHSKEWAAKRAAVKDLQVSDPAQALFNAEQHYAGEARDNGMSRWRDTGASPTIAEASGDHGLAGTEQAVRLSGDPNVDASISKRFEARQRERSDKLGSTLDSAAHPEDVSAFFKQRQEALDQALNDTVPGGAKPEEMGSKVKEAITDSQQRDRATRKQLYDAIDPEGNLHIISEEGPNAARQLLEQHAERGRGIQPPLPPLEAAEDIARLQNARGVVPFSNLTALRERFNAAIRKARAAGDDAVVRQYTLLKQGLDRDINNAVAAQQQAHLNEINMGVRSEGDTLATQLSNFESWLQRQLAERTAARAADAGRGSSTAAGAGAGARAEIPDGIAPAAGTAGRGPNLGADGAGVAGTSANMDKDAIARLWAANEFNKYYKSTYAEGATGKLLRPNAVSDAGVPAKVFPGGDKGYETTKHVLTAGHHLPEIVTAMGDVANASLRKIVDANGGRLTAQALEKWRNQHGGSLRAIDEAHPGFSDRYNNLANAQSQLATQFVGFKDPTSAARGLGKIARSPNGPKAISDLLAESGMSADVREGLKHLLINDLMESSAGNAVLPGTREPVFSGVKFRDNLNKMRPSLEQVFSPEHMQVMDRLAADFESQFMHEQRLKGPSIGPNTARNLELLETRLKQGVNTGAGGRDITLPLLGQTLATHGLGAAAHMMLGVAGSKVLNSLVHGFHSRNIRNMNDVIKAGMTDPEIGLRMLRHHVDEHLGSPSWAHRVQDVLERSPYYTVPGASSAIDREQEKKREKHAKGGRVGMDHAAHASRLVRLVDEAKKDLSKGTEKLLGAHDNVIARALEISNGAI